MLQYALISVCALAWLCPALFFTKRWYGQARAKCINSQYANLRSVYANIGPGATKHPMYSKEKAREESLDRFERERCWVIHASVIFGVTWPLSVPIKSAKYWFVRYLNHNLPPTVIDKELEINAKEKRLVELDHDIKALESWLKRNA